MRFKSGLLGPGKAGPLRDFGLLILRVGFAGTLALTHGLGKLQSVARDPGRFPDPLGIGSTASLGLATFAEFGCAIALILGFMSRLACVPLVITFVVAFFVYHGADPMEERELALLYLLAFAGLLFTGPGRFSVDEWLRRK